MSFPHHLKSYFLNPGELIFSKKPIMIQTVLGSCVAVCLYDKAKKNSGMCHYLLPEANENIPSTKYGNIAVPTLINKFLASGSQLRDLEATIIGGAFIIFSEKEIFFIGDRNAEIASNLVKKSNIRIKSINTGGDKGKKVIFDTEKNHIMVKVIEHIEIDDLYKN
ncbi:MAG: archease [Spirochaetes bacterium GWB1_36_13]|nr:MAG: archease [Spirochaetes bacterium GWB1_36_13]